MRRSWMIMVLSLVTVALLALGCANKFLTSGKIALNSRNYDKAINDFNQALKADSTNAEAHFLLGKAYKEKLDYIAMRRHFDKAVGLDPKFKDEVEATSITIWGDLFNSGNKNAKEEKWQDALDDFQTAIIVLPTKYEAYTNKGYVFQQLEGIHIDSARTDPDNAEAHTVLSKNFGDSAYTYYSEAVRLDPTNIKVLINFANTNYNMGRYDEADSLFGKILEAEPANYDALVRRGDIADQKGNFEAAAGFYNKALEIKPDQCDIWFNLGVIYFQKIKNLENAEQAFSRASEHCGSDDVNALVNLNVVLISLGKFDDAITRLNTFTELHPDECVGWDLLSQALIRKGDKDRALEINKKYEDCKGTKK